MRTNTQEAVLSAYIACIGKRTPREAAQDAAELCRLANSLSHLNEIAWNSGLYFTKQEKPCCLLRPRHCRRPRPRSERVWGDRRKCGARPLGSCAVRSGFDV